MTTGDLLHSFGRLRALVVGDICLDRWCTYDPALSEPSRETGLDRIAVIAEEQTAGGGGTVANNLAAMGLAHVAVLGLADDRGHGVDLLHALENRGIDAARHASLAVDPNVHLYQVAQRQDRSGGPPAHRLHSGKPDSGFPGVPDRRPAEGDSSAVRSDFRRRPGGNGDRRRRLPNRSGWRSPELPGNFPKRSSGRIRACAPSSFAMSP